MITGFNTDIEFDGVVYHVQTEDKGLKSPLILSLVYSGGAILASKRTPYQDLISAGFDEELLTERLKRQHRLICAAISAGRLDDLKRMSSRPESPPLAPPQLDEVERDEEITVEIPIQATDMETGPAVEASSTEKQKAPSPPAAAYSIYDPRRQAPLKEVSGSAEGLQIRILDKPHFQAGESLSLRIMVVFRSGGKEKPKAGVPVSVKVLGTGFRPQIYSVKTQRDGVAVFPVQIPAFTSGRAAILVRAAVGSEAVELRRVIRSAQWVTDHLVDIILNGEPGKVAENSSLQQLIYNLDLAPEKIALELNRQVVRRADWSSTVLKEGDQVEIVHFVGGGRGRWRPLLSDAFATASPALWDFWRQIA